MSKTFNEENAVYYTTESDLILHIVWSAIQAAGLRAETVGVTGGAAAQEIPTLRTFLVRIVVPDSEQSYIKTIYPIEVFAPLARDFGLHKHWIVEFEVLTESEVSSEKVELAFAE